MQGLLGKRGVDWMKPRSRSPTRAIHVSLPIRLLRDFDDCLRYTQSRSGKIANLIRADLESEGGTTIIEASTRQLMAALHARDDVDETMKHLLLQILTKTP